MRIEAMEGGPRMGLKRPRVVLGDRFGCGCRQNDVVDPIEAAFSSAVLPSLNTKHAPPFAGGIYHAGLWPSGAGAARAYQWIELDRSPVYERIIGASNGDFEDAKKRHCWRRYLP